MTTKAHKSEILAQFDDIIAQGDLNQVVPFLTAHKTGNVSELKKQLNKARHHYLDWHEYEGILGDDNHQRIIFCFALGLLSASDFNSRWLNCFSEVLNRMCDLRFTKNTDNEKNNYQMIFDIIKNFEFKSLFNKFYMEFLKVGGSLDYAALRKLETANLVEYNSRIFAQGLATFILWGEKLEISKDLDGYTKIFLGYDIPSRDLKNLFEYGTSISQSRFYGIKDDRLTGQMGEYWLYLIPQFIKYEKLEREFVLQKCLENQSKNWSKYSKNFFKDLFKALNPSDQEILVLQDNLFMLLQNELKPTVNFALDTLKPFILHQAFNLEEFLTFVSPIMMNGEYKGAIKTLLTQFDKILKLDSNHITLIYPSLCNVLFVNDLSLQEKAVKLLVKYANQETLGNEWESLIFQIEALFDSLPNDIKTLLAPLYQIQSESNEPQTQNITQALLSDTDYHYDPVVRVDYFSDDNKIALYSEFNDILFNFGQLEYSNNPLDIEIFMASWLQLKAHQQFPNDYLEQVKAVLEKYRNKYADNGLFLVFKDKFIYFILNNDYGKVEKNYPNGKFVYSYMMLLKKFVGLNQSHNTLSLLSTPTHLPAFIEPKVLVKRLIAYQNANIEIDLTDYAIALARMPRVNIEPAIELLSEINDTLILESLKFALGLTDIGETIPPKQISELFDYKKDEHYQAWRGVFATIAKTHYPNIELDYSHEYKKIFDKVIAINPLEMDYVYDPIINYDYDFKHHKRIEEETGNYTIEFNIKDYLSSAHTSDIYRKSCYKYQYLIYEEKYFTTIALLPKYLMPLNQADYDKYISSYVFSDGENINQHLLPVVERFMSEDYPYNAYTQFILVACLFAKDKAVRLAGIDAMIFAINHSRLDPDMFAKHSSQWIGHFSAPFSRYVECLAQLSQYDPLYQKVLLQLIEKTIMQLEFKNKLPTNFKKYLEIYYLLLSSLNKKADKGIMEKLQQWLAISNSIKTIMGKIDKL